MPGHKGGRAGRAARWRDNYWTKLQQAASDVDRLAVALDHLRMVVKNCVPADKRANVIDAVLAELTGVAEDHLAQYEQKGRRA